MFIKSLIVPFAAASGFIGLTVADISGVITSTRVFSNVIQGGAPVTLITTISPSATGLAPLPPVTFLSTVSGNHVAPETLTRTSALVTLPPSVYLSPVPTNHAPPNVYTMTSYGVSTSTLTLTDFATSILTLTGPTETVTVQLSEVSGKPSIVTGFCYWGQGGVEIPCTYTASNLPNKISPTATYYSHNGTRTNGSEIVSSTPSSAAISIRGNPLKFLVDGFKNLASREAVDTAQFDGYKVDNSTEYITTSQDKLKLRNCDHVILHLIHALNPSNLLLSPRPLPPLAMERAQPQQSLQRSSVLLFIVLWGLVFPSFVYIEVYTNMMSAWRDYVRGSHQNASYPMSY